MDLQKLFNTETEEDQPPQCGLCHAVCGKSLGAHRQTANKFWGGSKHGAKVFYTDDNTYYFCSEAHRTAFFFGQTGSDAA